MILYDIYDIGYYLDSKTLEPTTNLELEEIARISKDFSGIFYCRGYVIVFSRNRIELLTQDKYTELTITNGRVYNNGLQINQHLKLPIVKSGLLFKLPHGDDDCGVKIVAKNINNRLERNIKLTSLNWIKGNTKYKEYKRKVLLGG